MAHIRCWNCVGNGIVRYPPKWEIERCPDCKGTGADIEATKSTRVMSDSEKSIPTPLGKLPNER